MTKRGRGWERDHQLIPLHMDLFNKVKKRKGQKTYDQFFGDLLNRMEEL
jgi:hypothetical protein